MQLTLVEPHADDKKLVVDRCEACSGFWLDPGELQRFRDIASSEDDATLDRVEWKSRPDHVSRLSWCVKLISEAF